MSDYIKREDAAKEMALLMATEAEADGYPDTPIDDYIEYALEDIADIPSADVAPVRHGRWIPHPIMGYKEWDVCSECGFGTKRREYGVGDDGREWVEEYQYVFCPYCGAKMDGGGEE